MTKTPKSVTILGSTGSIGQSTLKVVAHHKQDFDVYALTANTNIERLAEQAIAFQAQKAVIADESLYGALKERLSGTSIAVSAGPDALTEIAQTSVDFTMASIMGIAGLPALFEAVRRGGTIAIANKEPLVSAGPQILDEAKKSGATLLPVDSEHNAIFQILEEENRKSLKSLVLTASGGPFHGLPLSALENVSVHDALQHPNWSMGQKITIDSATLMNKALEVIEAYYFFGIPKDQIKVLVHPQSLVHAMVEYCDGSVLTHMGAPDMCTAITYCLGWPRRLQSPGQSLDLNKLSELTFMPVDNAVFQTVPMAYDALTSGQGACIAFNAANEIAVQAFLNKEIAFLDIQRVVGKVLENIPSLPYKNLNEILNYDLLMREKAREFCQTPQRTTTKVA